MRLKRKVLIIWLISILALLPGCTNIREVETWGSSEQPIARAQFIGKNEAIRVVESTQEVAWFKRTAPYPCLIRIVQYPTAKDPVYIIEAAEDQRDHLVVFQRYRVDAYTGRILEY